MSSEEDVFSTKKKWNFVNFGKNKEEARSRRKICRQDETE
jgi:hypothetical protein